ncbi:hypothetical protein B0H14DRAFT_2580636 [Mycena olivaceomarginata]|nr:hypothetical protein B0H14DRAFT_2580636 [Mycena olivaceomarginata]
MTSSRPTSVYCFVRLVRLHQSGVMCNDIEPRNVTQSETSGPLIIEFDGASFNHVCTEASCKELRPGPTGSAAGCSQSSSPYFSWYQEQYSITHWLELRLEECVNEMWSWHISSRATDPHVCDTVVFDTDRMKNQRPSGIIQRRLIVYYSRISPRKPSEDVDEVFCTIQFHLPLPVLMRCRFIRVIQAPSKQLLTMCEAEGFLVVASRADNILVWRPLIGAEQCISLNTTSTASHSLGPRFWWEYH